MEKKYLVYTKSFIKDFAKGYNSVVECYLDVIEVISSSLIIPNDLLFKIKGLI